MIAKQIGPVLVIPALKLCERAAEFPKQFDWIESCARGGHHEYDRYNYVIQAGRCVPAMHKTRGTPALRWPAAWIKEKRWWWLVLRTTPERPGIRPDPLGVLRRIERCMPMLDSLFFSRFHILRVYLTNVRQTRQSILTLGVLLVALVKSADQGTFRRRRIRCLVISRVRVGAKDLLGAVAPPSVAPCPTKQHPKCLRNSSRRAADCRLSPENGERSWQN